MVFFAAAGCWAWVVGWRQSSHLKPRRLVELGLKAKK